MPDKVNRFDARRADSIMRGDAPRLSERLMLWDGSSTGT